MSVFQELIPEGYDKSERNGIIFKLKEIANKYLPKFKTVDQGIKLSSLLKIFDYAEILNKDVSDTQLNLSFAHSFLFYDSQTNEPILSIYGKARVIGIMSGSSSLSLLKDFGIVREEDYIYLDFIINQFKEEFVSMLRVCRRTKSLLPLLDISPQMYRNIMMARRSDWNKLDKIEAYADLTDLYGGDHFLEFLLTVKLNLKDGKQIVTTDWIGPKAVYEYLSRCLSLKAAKIRETCQEEDEILIDENL